MRRKIALLMVMIMTINLFQGMTFAVELRNTRLTHLIGQGIAYDEAKKELILSETKEEDEITLAIPIGEISSNKGSTVLSYYMDEGGKTQRVDIEFTRTSISEDEDALGNIDIVIRVYEHNGSVFEQKELKYATLETPYTAQQTPKSAKEWTGTLSLNVGINNRQDKEEVITIEDSGITRLEFFYDEENRTINFSTTNIKAGYEIPFMWANDGVDFQNQFNVFTGVEEMAIEPTHLIATDSALGFYSKDVINLSHESIQPGSKPGVVVSFNIPKVLSDGQFKNIDEVESASELEAALTLDIRSDNEPEFMIYTFSLNNPDQMIIEQGGRYRLYVSQDSEQFERVHEEPRLDSAEVITAKVTTRQRNTAGNIVANTETTSTVVGATYTEVEVSRITDSDIQFKVEPFKYETNQIMYQLYRKASSFAGDLDSIEQEDLDDTLTDEIMEGIKNVIVESASRLPEDRTAVGLHDVERQEEIYVINAYTTEGESIKMHTQAIMYESNNNVLPLRTVRIESYNNTYVLEGLYDVPQIAVTDMTLSMPDYDELVEKLETGDIYYELYIETDDETESQMQLSPILVLKGTLKNNQPTLEIYSTVGEVPKENEFVVVKQPNASGLVTIPGIPLKGLGNTTPWESLVIPEMVNNKYPDAKNITATEMNLIPVPSIRQTQIKTIFEPKDGLNSMINTTESNYKPLTLSVTKEIVPTPYFKEMFEQEIGDTSAIIKFLRTDLEKYFNSMINPLEQEIERGYEFYLAKAEGDLDLEEGRQNRVIIEKTPGATEESTSTHIINLLKERAEDGRTYAEKLNDGETICIVLVGDNLDPSENDEGIRLALEGLDYNTPYYAQLRLEVDNLTTGEKTYSSLSKVLSFTTGTEVTSPKPEDRRPPVPQNYEQYITEDTEDSSITLTWEKPDIEDVVGVEGDEEYIYFEMLRTTNAQDIIYDNVDLDTFEGMGMKMFKTNGADQIIDQYTDRTGWTNLGEQETYEQTEAPFTGKFVLVEEEPLPNTIYYYYIRTVRVMTEGSMERKAYSEWIMTPVTTYPVKAPIDLKVELDEDYDAQSEVIVSFLASIPEEIIAPVKPGQSGFDFDFDIRGEAVDDIEDVQFEYIRKVQDNGIQTRVYYRITGLNHATRYDIKVRILDYTLSLEDPSSSLYSNLITIRTDYSEEEQNKEDAYDEYLELYDRETDKLKFQSYWTAQDNKNQVIYKYREEYLKNELILSSTYELTIGEGVEEVIYYLPKETLNLAEEENVTIITQFEDYELYVRPGVVEKNEVIEDATKAIKDNDIEDYYIELSITNQTSNGRVEGQEAILPVINIGMQVVEIEDEDRLIEEEIKTVLFEEISEGRENMIEFLEDELEGGSIEPSYLEERTLEEVQKVREYHEEEVQDLLDKTTHDTEEIEELHTTMLLIAQTEESNVQGYYKEESKWTSVYTNAGYKGYSMPVAKLGQYTVVAGDDTKQELLSHIAGADDLFNKYHLEDFFQLSNTSLSQPVTKEAMYGSIARILGATRGTDYLNYLKNRGINLEASYNPMSYVRQDEMIYILMQGYEKMYYKNVNQIQINNKQAIQNIGVFQPKYRPYIQASVELGVVQTVNNQVLPSSVVSAETFIKMLTRIMPR